MGDARRREPKKKKKKKMVISHSDRVDLWRLKSIMQFYALQLFLDAPVCSYPSVFHLFMSPFMRRTICFYYWMLYPYATQESVFAPFKSRIDRLHQY